MKYKCLRDCFVEGVLWRAGEVYNLPDTMEKSEKNFKPLDTGSDAEEESPKTKPEIIHKGFYWCTKCEGLHQETSGIGKRHMKYIEESVSEVSEPQEKSQVENQEEETLEALNENERI